jgi:hypothetical protein
MGQVYSVKRSNVTVSTTNDLLALISNATRSARVISIEIGGLGTSSAANSIGVYRVATAGVTPGGAVTPTPANPASPAAGFTAPTTFATQPVLGTLVKQMDVNANGGINRWNAIPGKTEIEFPGGAAAPGSLSIRGISGTSNIDIEVWVEEF